MNFAAHALQGSPVNPRALLNEAINIQENANMHAFKRERIRYVKLIRFKEINMTNRSRSVC